MGTPFSRYTQKVFGSLSAADQIRKFGSLFAGSPANAANAGEVMSLSNWLEGWPGAAIGGNAPAIEDMNAFCYATAYQLAYIMQKGVCGWDVGTTYFIGDIVSVSGTLYGSLTNDNLANAVSDESNWKILSNTPAGSGQDYWGTTAPRGWVFASGKTIGNGSSNATERANADTLDLYTILWEGYSDSILPIYTSGGVLSTRGASAAVDFAANKAVTLIDKRGRASVGKDDMGGTAANRITSATMSPDGTTIGAVGGTQTHTLSSGEMPSHTHTQDAHTHTQDAHTHLQNQHTHPIRQITYSGSTTDSGPTPNFTSSFSGGTVIQGQDFQQLFANNATATNQNTTATNQNTTATNQNTGGGGAHLNLQPSIACNYIIKL